MPVWLQIGIGVAAGTAVITLILAFVLKAETLPKNRKRSLASLSGENGGGGYETSVTPDYGGFDGPSGGH
jgi:hypothetical protein